MAPFSFPSPHIPQAQHTDSIYSSTRRPHQPILVSESTYIGRQRDQYRSERSYIGRPSDLYRFTPPSSTRPTKYLDNKLEYNPLPPSTPHLYFSRPILLKNRNAPYRWTLADPSKIIGRGSRLWATNPNCSSRSEYMKLDLIPAYTRDEV